MCNIVTSHNHLSKNTDDLLTKIKKYHSEYKKRGNKEFVNILGDIYNSLLSIYKSETNPQCSAENNDNINF